MKPPPRPRESSVASWNRPSAHGPLPSCVFERGERGASLKEKRRKAKRMLLENGSVSIKAGINQVR